MKINLKLISKKCSAYIVAVLVFVFAALVYCYPVVSGKKINAGDTQRFLEASAESRNFAAQTGDNTWWTGSMFSGMPNYQVGGGHFKSSDILKPAVGLLQKCVTGTVWKLIMYFLCFFILLRCFNVDKWLSIVGGLAIGLSSYFLVIIPAGHNTKAATIALIAVVVGGFYLIFRKKYALGFVLTMLFTAAGFYLHPQMFYYYCMMIGLMWIAELCIHIKEKRIKDFLIGTLLFGMALGIGLGTGAANVFANREYISETIRGGSSELEADDSGAAGNGLDLEYATAWSYGIDETMSFLIPGFKGGSSSYDVGKNSETYRQLKSHGISSKQAVDFCSAVPTYWGNQPFTAGNVYMGAIVCFLFILGLIVVKGPYKWALLTATLFSTALAWGHNFMWLTEFFFKYFPMYNKFRAVSSILIVAEVAMPLLGFMALREIMEGKIEKLKAQKYILVSAAVTAGICLFFAIFGRMIFNFSSPEADSRLCASVPDWLFSAILADRASIFAHDSFRSAVYIVLAAGLLWLFVKGKIKTAVMIPVLGLLVVADLWTVDKRYFNDDCFVTAKVKNANMAKYPYEEAILADTDPNFRVFNVAVDPFNDSRTSLYFKSIGGYCAVKLRRYQDLITHHISNNEMPVINMLNAKYFIMKDENGNPSACLNPDAFGNAWFVDSIGVVNNAKEESDALRTMDLRTSAVADKSFAAFLPDYVPGISENADVRLLSYTPKALDYVCSNDVPGTLVFSEIYYPYGWKAYLDGVQTNHFRVNYVLRAMNVPAGEHTIRFEFDPDSIRKGETVATIFIVLMYLIIAGAIVYGVLKWRKSR